MENALVVYQNQVILGSVIVLLISFIGLVSLFTIKISDKTLIGSSMKELDLIEGLSENDKFNLIVIHYSTFFGLVLLMILIYIVGHMWFY